MPILKPIRAIQLNKSHPFARGLIGYWIMNEGGGSKVFDLSGNDNTGTFVGNTAWAAGKFGSCLSFDGSGDYVDVADKPMWDTGGQITVSLWFKTSTQQTQRGMLIHDVSAYKYLAYITALSGRLEFYIRTLSGVSSANTGDLGAGYWSDGSWHHFVGVFNKGLSSNRLKLYVDGVERATNDAYAEDISTGDEGINIGRWGGAAASDFAGQIDNAMIFNRALSVSEIVQLHREPFCMFEVLVSPAFFRVILPPVLTGIGVAALKPTRGTRLNKSHFWTRNLKACYLFDAGTGWLAEDASENRNKGVISHVSEGVTWDTGRHGSALKFNANNNDCVEISDDRLPPFNLNDFTILSWVKHPQDGATRTIISKGYVGYGQFTFHKHESDRVRFYGDQGGIIATHPTVNSWPDDKWVHIAVTRKGALLSVYQDGILVATDPSADKTLDSDKDWRIGNTSENALRFGGKIDCLFIYDRAFTASEIMHHRRESFCMFEVPVSPALSILVSEDVTIEPSTLELVSSLETPGILIGHTIIPDTFALASALPTPEIIISSTILPGSLSLEATLLIPEVFTGVAVVPDTLALALTQEIPDLHCDTVYFPSAFGLALLLYSPTIDTGIVLVTPDSFALISVLPVPQVITFYADIPPFMQKDIIDPYSGGAWLWLVEIAVPGQAIQRIARNTEDLVYGGDVFNKWNIDLGEQIFSGDGTIPRVTLRIFQDVDRTIEDIINATEGALGAGVKLIRVNEKYLDSPVAALEANYKNLTAESDTEWVTFVLGIPNPLTQRVPLRTFSSSICPFATPTLFKGPSCQYSGGDGTCKGTYEDCYQKGNAAHWGGALGLDPNVVRI